jgi:hypothetical protein
LEELTAPQQSTLLVFMGLQRLAGKTPVISRDFPLEIQITGKNPVNPRQFPYTLAQSCPLAGEIPFIHPVAVGIS